MIRVSATSCVGDSSNRGTLVFVEQFYFPDGWGGAQLPRDITMSLAKGHWRVKVICGSDPYAPVIGEPQVDPATVGVKISRIPRLFSGGIHRLKLLRQLWFYLAALPRLLFSRVTIYVTQTNPPLVVPIVACIAKLRMRPFIIIAQDIYPEVLFAHTMLSRKSMIGRMLSWLFGWAYRRADTVVSLGPGMTRRLREKGVSTKAVCEICNWATGELTIPNEAENVLRSSWGLGGKFVVLYSGNIGIAHDVHTPVSAIARCKDAIPNIVLLFIGAGSRQSEAEALVKEFGVESFVQFRPFVPFDQLSISMAIADIALVTLRPGFEGLVVPSKLLGYMGRGIPTLYIGPDGDVSHLLSVSGGGRQAVNGDFVSIARILEEMSHSKAELRAMGDSARTYYRRHLAKEIGLARYQNVVDSIVQQSN